MLTKESKIRVLENFYSLDYVFFGKPLSKVDEGCCPLAKEDYLAVKGALMSVYVEMLKIIEHKPTKLTSVVETSDILKNAREIAKVARENARGIVSSPKSRDNIKLELQEQLREDSNTNTTAWVEQKVREKAFGMAVDNVLIARALSESTNFDKLNEWEGRLIEDSYKILRDSLVEGAFSILY